MSLYRIVRKKNFENFIIAAILLGTFRLISETFIKIENTAKSDHVSAFFDIFDVILNIIFIAECIMKILSMGFVMEKGSYLRDSWNKLDFLIVCVSLFDFQIIISKYSSDTQSSTNVGFLKVLRMLRILRPLRFISHNVQLKLIINALFDSIQSIINVTIIVIIVFFIFSIIGISLFSSMFYQCYLDSSPVGDTLELTNSNNVTILKNTTLFLNEVSNF